GPYSDFPTPFLESDAGRPPGGGAAPDRHHAPHISRKAFPRALAPPAPSVRGERSIMSRSPARSFARPGRSDARRAATPTYSSPLCATSCGRPILERSVTPTREACVAPASATTRSSIQIEKQLGVLPC